MAEGVWKVVYPKVFGRSRQLSLNKFFDPSTPSMRKGRDGENGMEWEKNGKQVGLSRATLESQVKVFLLVLLKSKYTDATVQLDQKHNFLERIVPCPELSRPDQTCPGLTCHDLT